MKISIIRYFKNRLNHLRKSHILKTVTKIRPNCDGQMAEKPEDLNLPNAVITRIIKDALPDAVNISKEARAAISKAASVFVLYATSSANNFAVKSKRKTLTGQDVLAAMQDMEFEKFVEPLTECLENFKKEQKGKREANEKKKKSKQTAKKTDNKSKETENLEDDDKTTDEQPNDEEL